MDPTFQTNLMNVMAGIIEGYHRPLYFQEPSKRYYLLTNLEDIGDNIASLYRVLELREQDLSIEEHLEIIKKLDLASEYLDLATKDLERKGYNSVLMN